MNEQFKEQITAKAREFAASYTNRHFPNQPAFAFGNDGWAKFVDALVELSHPKSIEADSDVIAELVGHVPDAGKMVADRVPESGNTMPGAEPVAWQITYASADGTTRTVVHGHNAIGDYRQIDLDAKSTALYAAPVVPVPVASAWMPIETAPKDSGSRLLLVNGYCVQGFVDATGVLHAQSEIPPHWRKLRGNPTHWMPLPPAPGAAPPQAAPVAQLSEPLTDEQMDSIYRDVWTTVPHGKRLFEFGRRVLALAAAPTTPKEPG